MQRTGSRDKASNGGTRYGWLAMAEMRVVAGGPDAELVPGEPAVSVVVTLFNEAQPSTSWCVAPPRRSTAPARSWELILVDDGSSDGTWAEVERLHAADERVRGVRFRRNAGQHPAMHAGLSRARAATSW